MIISLFILFAVYIQFNVNKLTNKLCIQRNIPEEKQENIFRTVNVLILILLVSSYIEILYI